MAGGTAYAIGVMVIASVCVVFAAIVFLDWIASGVRDALGDVPMVPKEIEAPGKLGRGVASKAERLGTHKTGDIAHREEGK